MGVPVAVPLPVRLSVIDGVERGVDELMSLPDGEVEGVGTALGELLGLPPKEIVDGGVDEDDGDCEGLGLGVTVSVVVGVIVPVPLEEIEDDCNAAILTSPLVLEDPEDD